MTSLQNSVSQRFSTSASSSSSGKWSIQTKAATVCYGDNHRNYPKPVHNIGSNGAASSVSWNKNYRGPLQQTDFGTFDQRFSQGNQ
jgi:hypothetical protein